MSRGTCDDSEGNDIAQCNCDKGWFGAGCCLNKNNASKVTGGIVAGVIAAIVIAGIIAFVLMGYCLKLGLHWARFGKIIAAAKNNPLYQDDGTATAQVGAASAAGAEDSEAGSQVGKDEASVEDGVSQSAAEPAS
jgi:hypothetical protein